MNRINNFFEEQVDFHIKNKSIKENYDTPGTIKAKLILYISPESDLSMSNCKIYLYLTIYFFVNSLLPFVNGSYMFGHVPLKDLNEKKETRKISY